jgi:hypothetical protein
MKNDNGDETSGRLQNRSYDEYADNEEIVYLFADTLDYSQTLPAHTATIGKNGTSGGSLHALAKAAATLANDLGWIVCRLHCD